jgi:sugar transferase (PEP-CTERM/EpsH1 system associated)
MRILYIVPNVPSAIRTRPYNLLKHLSRRHDIELICLQVSDYETQFISALSDICLKVTVVKRNRLTAISNALRAVPGNTPVRLAYFHSPELRATVARRLAQGKLDVVHVEHAKAAQAVPKIPFASVCDAVDSNSLLLARRRDTAKGLSRVYLQAEHARMQRLEATTYTRFDRVVVTSSIDAAYLVKLTHGRVSAEVVTNGVDLEYFAPASRQFAEDAPAKIVFVGKLDYAPNVEAALFMSKVVFPIVTAAIPDAQLWIVGANPPREVRSLARRPGVHITGYVSDIRPHLRDAVVSVAPLLAKAGVQNKLLEAMAMGVPVVATSLAVQALGVRSGDHLLTGDTPESFAIAVQRIVRDKALRGSLIAAGRRYVERNHDWAAVADKLALIHCEAFEERSALAREHS